MRSDDSSRQAGFSLLDLALAITILGLMCAVSLPAFGRLGERHSLLTEASRLRALMERLSVNSELYDQDFILELKRDSYSIRQKDSGKIIQTRQLQKPILISLKDNKPVEIEYRNGRSNTALSFELKASNIFCKFVLSLRGRVTQQC